MPVAKSAPTIIINDIPIAVVPNSVTYKKGLGEINVRAASVGGGAAISVHNENIENKFGMVKFQIYATDDLIQQFPTWKELIGNNVVSGVDRRGIPFNLLFASFINDPEIPATSDGVIDVEFHGDPMAL